MTEATETRTLIERAVAGDRVALERLMLDHYDPLARHIAGCFPRSLQGALGVEDIVQQTFAQVFARMERYEPRADAGFLSWLIAIADNRLRDAIRAQQRKKRGGGRARVPVTSDENDSRAANLFDIIAGSGNTPSQSIARREGIRAIQVAVAGLPDEYRQAIELRYFEGFSLEETADLMGRTTGAVRGLLDRAKARMRDALERASRFLSDK